MNANATEEMPARRNAIVMLSIGERPWAKHTRKPFEAFCRRHDCDFVFVDNRNFLDEFTLESLDHKRGRKNKKPYAGKTYVAWKYLQTYEYVAVADDSCTVGPKCPDFFRLVPHGSVGFTNTSPLHAKASFDDIVQYLTRNSNKTPIELDSAQYMNSGFLVYHRAMRAAIEPQRMARASELLNSSYPHQTLTYYLLKAANIPLTLLPKAFNRVPSYGNVRTRLKRMPWRAIHRAHIWHVTGAYVYREQLAADIAAKHMLLWHLRALSYGKMLQTIAGTWLANECRHFSWRDVARALGASRIKRVLLKTYYGKRVPFHEIHFAKLDSAAGGMSEQEYRIICSEMSKRAPSNVLVFGTGFDSGLWLHCNPNGSTLFVEDSEPWIAEAKRRYPNIRVEQVLYSTVAPHSFTASTDPNPPELDLSEHVTSRTWDIIVVDAPKGSKPDAPGRSQSIFAAAQLRKSDGVVFVHDLNRSAEAALCRRWLGEPPLVTRRLAMFGPSSMNRHRMAYKARQFFLSGRQRLRAALRRAFKQKSNATHQFHNGSDS